MNILLIAGHGAGDPGATSQINGITYREAEEVRTLLDLLRSELTNKYTVNVGVFATNRNAYTDLRCGKLPYSVFKGYDYALELHMNALRSEKADGHTKGVECYVTTGEKSVGVELQICGKIAALGLTNRGVKRKNFSVIHAAKSAGVSSALLEVCFIDDPDDMTIYLKNKKAIARAIADGVAAGFGLEKKQRTAREIVQQGTGFSDATMKYLDAYKYSSDLYNKLVEWAKKGE